MTTHGMNQTRAKNIMPDDGNQIFLLTDNQLIQQVDFLSVEDEYNYTENWIVNRPEHI